MEEESIYNLIPKEYVPPPKPKRYKSKYPAEAPPTASTFGLKTTSKVLGNVAGDYEHFDGPHRSKSLGATFGKAKGSVKPDPQSYRKKGTGTMKLPEATNKFSYTAQERRPPIPKNDEKPIMGLKTDKNFIVANAVEVILKAPKTVPEQPNPLQKKDFGQVPQYLNKIKGDIEEEYNTLKQLKREQEEEQEKQKYLVSQEEVKELRDGLKKKWEAVNKEYQMITHIRKPDTQGLKRKKENCEKELAQLEKDMAALDRAYVFVDSTA
ncbi:ENKUR_2 [Blepharisma stoltei]|uniref:Enkurin domain-containing protein n=1 Tax=Blepharisma stoltei TaxID=1481888 RepID=A0AAU9JIV4_9CILI|nr:unnamed protein product [Blepharisma stoltei]